jgi:hypothetical protein
MTSADKLSCNPILDGELYYLWVRTEHDREVKTLWVVLYAAVPHLASDDDVYQGYFIPKGAIVIPNVW